MLTWLRHRKILRERRKLEVKYGELLQEARDLQRGGDIQGYARKTDEAETLARRIDEALAREQARPS